MRAIDAFRFPAFITHTSRMPETYPRVWLTSDVHTDRAENLQWVKDLPDHGASDVLIVAGNVSSNIRVLEETLTLFTERFGKVFFLPGNHDLWVLKADGADTTSFSKIDQIVDMCERIGVSTQAELLHGTGGRVNSANGGCRGVWIVPLLSWYDLSLDIAACNPELEKFGRGMKDFSVRAAASRPRPRARSRLRLRARTRCDPSTSPH